MNDYIAIRVTTEIEFNELSCLFKEFNIRPYGGVQKYPSLTGTNLVCFNKIGWHWTAISNYDITLSFEHFIKNYQKYI